MSDEGKGNDSEKKAYENVKSTSMGQKKKPKCRTPIKVTGKNRPARGIYDPAGNLEILKDNWSDI